MEKNRRPFPYSGCAIFPHDASAQSDRMILLAILVCLCLLALTAAPPLCTAAEQDIATQMVRVSAGPGVMMVVRNDGRAWAWGLNGDFCYAAEPKPVRFLTSAKNPKPEPQYLENVTAVAVGDYFSYLLCADGILWAMGRNDDNRMGVPMGGKGTQYSPLKIMENVTQVAVTGTKTAVVKRDGTLWVWGSELPPAKLLDNVRRVVVSPSHGLALMGDGHLMAWGNNAEGQLGDGSRENRPMPVPVTVLGSDALHVVSLSAADGISVAVMADGKLHQWGRPPRARTTQKLPEQAPALPTEKVRSVAFGRKTLTLKTDGTLWISSDTAAPKQLLDNVAEASASEYGTFLALKNDGSFWGWDSALGMNFGETLDKPARIRFIDEPEPLSAELQKCIATKAALPPVPSLERPIEIQNGDDGVATIVLLQRNGVLWEKDNFAMKRNFTRVSPEKNPETRILNTRLLPPFYSPYHRVFFNNGILMAEGDNNEGQLGDGTVFNRDAPVPVRMPKGVTMSPERVSVIATAIEQSGLVMDGVIWLWGRRGLRESNSSPRSISTPQPLAFAAGEVVDIALSEASILILTRDGTLWDAGADSYYTSGAAQSKNMVWEDRPYKILTNVRSFASDGHSHVALKKDGSLWGWGRNCEYQFSEDREQAFDKPTRLHWKLGK